MKAQSALMPMGSKWADRPWNDVNRFPKEQYHHLLKISSYGHVNKGRDKDWYAARLEKNMEGSVDS